MRLKPPKQFKGYTTAQVYRITGVSVRKMIFWDNEGLVKPNSLLDRGKGKRRLYNLQDILCLKVVNALRERGVSLKKIKESVKRMEDTGLDHPLARLRVACLAQTLIFKRPGGQYIEPISGQLVIKEALQLIRQQKEPRRRMATTRKEAKSASLQFDKLLASLRLR